MAHKDKNIKEKISELLECLTRETSPSYSEGYADQIKKLVDKMAAYETRGRLNCHEALEFLGAAEKSFVELAADLKETGEKLNRSGDRRAPLFKALGATMRRLAKEAQEVRSAINHSSRLSA